MAADIFSGVRIVDPATAGRHSLLDKLALGLGANVENVEQRLELTDAELLLLNYDPTLSLRPVQELPRGTDWQTWFFCGGRGSGKSHAGAAACIIEASNDADARIVIVGPTYSEIVKTQLEGPSGIITLSPPWFRPKYEKARRKLVWANGAQATWLPAVNADKFRGAACSLLWADEFVAWKKGPVDTLNECYRVSRYRTKRMGKLGMSPRVLITTTPKPTKAFRHLMSEYGGGMVVARSSTFDNAANLDPSYIRYARRLSETVEGRREFLGELAFELDAGLFSRVDWDKSRVSKDAAPKRYDVIVVGVDPATGEKVGSHGADMHGISVVGLKLEADGLTHVYVLADLSFQSPEPSAWAKKAVGALRAWEPFAERAWVFAETNTGGSMVKSVLRTVDAEVPVKTERAQNSKAERAAPVSALAEAGLIHMVGKHHFLEQQLAVFDGSPGGHMKDDAVDAMTWPIWKYVVRRNKNKGALAMAADESAEG